LQISKHPPYILVIYGVFFQSFDTVIENGNMLFQ